MKENLFIQNETKILRITEHELVPARLSVFLQIKFVTKADEYFGFECAVRYIFSSFRVDWQTRILLIRQSLRIYTDFMQKYEKYAALTMTIKELYIFRLNIKSIRKMFIRKINKILALSCNARKKNLLVTIGWIKCRESLHIEAIGQFQTYTILYAECERMQVCESKSIAQIYILY